MTKEKALVWVGVGVVILGIFIFAISAPRESQPTTVPAVYAPKGQLIPQFPKELVLDASTTIDSSYGINYSSSTNQYTASWISSTESGVVAKDYLAYFKANGWTAMKNPSASTAVQSISATMSGQQALVTVVAQGSGSQITITYVK